MRVRPRLVTDDVTLEPFVDILTACLGSLFFIVALTGLIGGGVTGKVTTPILTDGDTRPVVFELRRGTILHPDIEGLRRRVQEEWDASEAQGLLDWKDKVTRLEKMRIDNDYYTFEPAYDLSFPNGDIRQSMYMTFIPKMTMLGERLSLFSEPNSKFRQALVARDPSRHHIYFFVDTESFEEFHVARDIAREAGFKVGWNPNEVGAIVRYRAGGLIETGSHF